jgi:hypothetical protein
MNNMYFIVGCGRSGTNWLAQIIDQHPDVFATIEHPDIFPIVTECALNPHNKKEKLKPVFDLYRKHASENKIYLDKSHPNLWHIDLIREEFPEAKFIGIQRDVYGVVSSMLQHEGCLTWVKNWKDYPLPNKFLGVTEGTAKSYEELDFLQRCVWRWDSHKDEMYRKVDLLSFKQRKVDLLSFKQNFEKFLFIDYSSLLWSHSKTIESIGAFMGISIPEGKPEYINDFKWVDNLTSQDCLRVELGSKIRYVAMEIDRRQSE